MTLPRTSPDYDSTTMAPSRPTRADTVPRPPLRDPPLPPPQQRPSLDAPQRNNGPRPIVRKPVPNPSRLNDANLVDASQVPSETIPTLPAPQRRVPLPRPPSHGRSISHPFPSLFSTRKKSPPKNVVAQDDFDSDSDSDAEMLGLGPGSARPRVPAQPTGSSNAKPLGDKDYVSGNCMACGALSRWPKGLKVFKCTLCVTINDLVDRQTVIETQNHAPSAKGPGALPESSAPNSRGTFVLSIPWTFFVT